MLSFAAFRIASARRYAVCTPGDTGRLIDRRLAAVPLLALLITGRIEKRMLLSVCIRRRAYSFIASCPDSRLAIVKVAGPFATRLALEKRERDAADDGLAIAALGTIPPRIERL